MFPQREENYEKYFNDKVNNDSGFRSRVLELKDKRLGCWCKCDPPCNNDKCCKKSLRCHLETIKNYLDNL